jgi:hypothetical protein
MTTKILSGSCIFLLLAWRGHGEGCATWHLSWGWFKLVWDLKSELMLCSLLCWRCPQGVLKKLQKNKFLLHIKWEFLIFFIGDTLQKLGFGVLPKFSPKILRFSQERFIFWQGSQTVLGNYCQIWFLRITRITEYHQIWLFGSPK